MVKFIADLNDKLFDSLALGSLFGSLSLTALILLFLDGVRGFLIVVGIYFSLLMLSYLISYWAIREERDPENEQPQ